MIIMFLLYIIHTSMQWLKHNFLGYLKEWEEEIALQKHLTPQERNRMCLSKETLEGLRMTG